MKAKHCVVDVGKYTTTAFLFIHKKGKTIHVPSIKSIRMNMMIFFKIAYLNCMEEIVFENIGSLMVRFFI